MTSSNCTVYFQSIAVLVAVLTIVTDVTASQPQVYKVFQTDVKLSTGACPWMYLDTEAACAIQCYMNTWCRVYVIGPCHLSAPNSCVCTICHMNPEVIENQAGRSSRKVRLSLLSFFKLNQIEHVYSAYPRKVPLHGVPDRPFQPLYLSQLPGEHYRGAVITNEALL